MTVGQYLVSSHDYRLIIVDRGFNLCFNLQFYIFFWNGLVFFFKIAVQNGGKNALKFVDAERNELWSIPNVAKIEISSVKDIIF